MKVFYNLLAVSRSAWAKEGPFLLSELFVKTLAEHHKTACISHWSLQFICKNNAYYCNRVVTQISFLDLTIKFFLQGRMDEQVKILFVRLLLLRRKGLADLCQLLVWFLYITAFNIHLEWKTLRQCVVPPKDLFMNWNFLGRIQSWRMNYCGSEEIIVIGW